MAQTYRDPTFDEVARREAQRQRKAKIRASRWYRVMKRRRIKTTIQTDEQEIACTSQSKQH